MNTGRVRIVVIALVVVLVAAVGGGVLWWRGGDAPAEVTLDGAVAAASSTTVGSGTGTPTTGAASTLDGTWTIRTGDGVFVGFRIDEELSGVGAKNVVGRTPGVTGSLTLAGATVTGLTIEADLTKIDTDSAQRTNALRTRGLETNTYPTAKFRQTSPLTLDAAPTPGSIRKASVVGELIVHGITKTVTVPVEAKLDADRTIVVVPPFEVRLADYGIEKPLVPGRVLSIADVAVFEAQLQLTR
jgi:polyisoprenoid-binding protein YceI